MARKDKIKIIGIYKITNKINGKMYVGQSINVDSRKRAHFRNNHIGCPILYNAMDKYGNDSFEFEIIQECDICELDSLEQYYIKELNTLSPNGYNLDTGGSNNKVLSEDTKQKISLAIQGEKNPMYGKTHSAEIKKVLKEVNQGRRASDETKQLLSDTKQLNKTNGSKKIKDNNGIVWGSISDCCYELNISNHLKDMLRGERKRTKIVEELDLQYANDDIEITQIIEHKTKDKKICKVFKPVIDKTGRVFKNIKECSDFYNIPRLSRILNKSEKNSQIIVELGIRFMTPKEIETNEDYLKDFDNKGKSKKLIDVNNVIYNSIKECSKILNIPHLKMYLSGKREMPKQYQKFGIRYLDAI